MSDDNRVYRVIKGRRWRISDPDISPALRQQLVNEVMSARRAVATANRADSDIDRSATRARVQTAKVALGERGPHWYYPMIEGDMTVRAKANLFFLF